MSKLFLRREFLRFAAAFLTLPARALLFRVETFSFRIPAAHFAEVLRSGVPARPFALSLHNVAGRPMDRDVLVGDIAGDYRGLATLSAAASAQSP